MVKSSAFSCVHPIQQNEGSESSSFVAITIEQKEKSGLDEHQLSWLGGTVWRVAYSSFRRDLHRLRETHSVAGTDSVSLIYV